MPKKVATSHAPLDFLSEAGRGLSNVFVAESPRNLMNAGILEYFPVALDR